MSPFFINRYMPYSDQVLDHYENPRNVGKLDRNDKSVGTGMVGAPACGDVMQLQILWEQEWLVRLHVVMSCNSKSK